MDIKTTSRKILCDGSLFGNLTAFPLQAEEPAEAVVRLELKGSQIKMNELDEQLFVATDGQDVAGEAAFPVDVYDPGNGPFMASGWRYNTHPHSSSIFLSNTANGSFNSAFTGGYKRDRLDLFGFDISIFI